MLVEEQQWYYLTYSWWNKKINNFPKGICVKMNIKVYLEFELAYFEVAVQHFSHNAMGASPNRLKYCYTILKILFNINCLHTVKWFRVLQFNFTNSVYQVILSNKNNLHIVV